MTFAPRIDRNVLVLAALASVGLLVALWIVDYLPTNDGPHHIFLGHLERRFDDPTSGLARYLERGFTLTALGFHAIFTTFERFFSWRNAFRLTLSVVVLLWAWGYFALVTAVHPRRAILGLVGFVSAFSWSLYMGFFSYTISIAFGFVILAVAVREWPWSPIRRAAISCMLLVQAMAHPFGAELTGLVLLALAAYSPSPRGRIREIGWLVLTALPAALIALTATSPPSGRIEWLSLVNRMSTMPRTFVPGAIWHAWPPFLLGLGGLVFAAYRARKRLLSPPELALLTVGTLCLVLSFSLPMHLSAWEYFSPRFLPFACLFGALLIPIEALSAVQANVASVVFVAFTATSLVSNARTNVSLRARVDDALAGLSSPVHRTGPRMVVPFDPYAGLSANQTSDGADNEIPYCAPLLAVGSLYAVEQGGIPSYSFLTNHRLHSFVLSSEALKRFPESYNPGDLRDEAVSSDPVMRSAILAFLAGVGMPFEDIVVIGRPEDADVFIQRGYAVDFRERGVFIGHLEGCPLTVKIAANRPVVAPVRVEYGIDPLPNPIREYALPADVSPGEGELLREIKIPRSLCGPIWLRGYLDRDNSTSPSKGDSFCTEADKMARIHATLGDRGGQTTECRLTP